MSYPATPCNPVPCYPMGHYDCWHPHRWAHYPQPSAPYLFLVCAPPECGGTGDHSQTIPYELTATTASTPQEVLIGGRGDVHLSLEYLADTGASAPAVDIMIEFAGTTSTWSESPIPTGYQVKSGFVTVQPGSKETLSVTEATAKLRWCETICC